MEQKPDEQLTPDETSAIAALRSPSQPSTELYERVRSDLVRQGAFKRPVRRWVGPLAAAAGIALAYVAAMRAATPPEPMPGPQYAFLLHNTPEARWPDGTSPTQIVEEFREWARPLASEGRLRLGDELADDHLLVDDERVLPGDRALGMNGMFIVSAPDDSSAIAIARTLPHVRQGGVVSVQRLMNR
jgi:hypothetical protein